MAYAMPPSKYWLRERNDVLITRATVNRHTSSPRVFNGILIVGILIPILLPMVPFLRAAKHFTRVSPAWSQADKACLDVIQSWNPTLNDPTQLNSPLGLSKQLQALAHAQTLEKIAESLWYNIRWMAAADGSVVFLHCLIAAYLHIRILRRLFSQINIVRQSYKRRQDIRLQTELMLDSSAKPSFDSRGCPFASKETEVPTDSQEISPGPSIKQHTPFWRYIFPSFKSLTEVDTSLWTSDLLNTDDKSWERKEEVLMRQQYATLRNLASNIVWVAVCMMLMEGSLILLASYACEIDLFIQLCLVQANKKLHILFFFFSCKKKDFNLFDVPHRMRLCDAGQVMLLWGQAAWG